MNADNYCVINTQTGVCENIIVWDGNYSSWAPPEGYLMSPHKTTPAKTWMINKNTGIWHLGIIDGEGQIGFIWDGSVLNTNMDQPYLSQPYSEQPTVIGAQVL